MKVLSQSGSLIWSDRWRLGALQPHEIINIALSSILMSFLFCAVPSVWKHGGKCE